jgi:hypothetical protein
MIFVMEESPSLPPANSEIAPPVLPYASARVPLQSDRPKPPYKLYTRSAVGLATFLGSPMAGAALMAINYKRLKRKALAWRTLILGIVASAALIAVAFFIPDSVSRSLQFAPAVVGIAGMMAIARALQGPQLENHARNNGDNASMWKAAGVGLISLVIVLGVILGAVLLGDKGLTGKINVTASEEIYYGKQATQADAVKLGEVLKAMGFLDGSGEKSVVLQKDGSGVVVKFVIASGAWYKPEVEDAFRLVGKQISNSGLGRPVTILLCDPELNEKNRIKIE